MKSGRKRRVANPIAERRLTIVGEPGGAVTVIIGKPRPDPAGDWRCSFRVEGIPNGRRQVAHGIDALQALLLAVEGVRAALDASGLIFTWEGGEPGDTGVPRLVPLFYGRDFAGKIERHIDQEVEAFAHAAKPELVKIGPADHE